MFKFSNKRMEYEEQMLEENSDTLPPNVQYQRIDRYNYILQIRGEVGSVHEGAYIIADVIVTTQLLLVCSLNGFPVEAPQVNFRNNFQHVNIFPMGALLFNLYHAHLFNYSILGQQRNMDFQHKFDRCFFRNQPSHTSVLNQVINLSPTFNDPANSLYKDSEVYEKDMKEQAKKFRDEKYKII